MEAINNLFKLVILNCLALSILICSSTSFVLAESDLDIYRINPELLDEFDVLEKGTDIDLVLTDDIYTQTMHGSVKLAANKLILSDSQEIYFSAESPIINAIHPPHTSPGPFNLAKYIALFSVSTSPLTLGASLGISFLANGLFSAYQNGLSDFIWGGLDGAGLSFIERLLRKPPAIYLSKGTMVPFTLKEDLKINKGIEKENKEIQKTNNTDAQNKINKLLQWGDLAGAIEHSYKLNQQDVYKALLQKINN